MLSAGGVDSAGAGRTPLSADEEVRLAKRIERGDLQAKARMIQSNLWLVHSVARSYRGRGVPLADLTQEGTLGLIHAVERFDHRRGVKLSTYAVWSIRHFILDAIAAASVIPIPPTSNRNLARVRRAESELERLGRRAASDAAIAERTQLSVRTVRALRTTAHVTASLDEPVGAESWALSDVVADERAVDPPARAIRRESCDQVRWMLSLLPERHREVIVRRYGLDATREQSHQEISQRLGMSEARSRQIEGEALRRLRSMAVPA